MNHTEIYIKPKDCSNLAKDYNGEHNWCVIKDKPCVMIYGLHVNEFVYYSPSELNPCKLKGELEGITVLPNKAKKIPEALTVTNPNAKYSKTCKRCSTHFKTDSKNKVFCADCAESNSRKRYREYNGKRVLNQRQS